MAAANAFAAPPRSKPAMAPLTTTGAVAFGLRTTEGETVATELECTALFVLTNSELPPLAGELFVAAAVADEGVALPVDWLGPVIAKDWLDSFAAEDGLGPAVAADWLGPAVAGDWLDAVAAGDWLGAVAAGDWIGTGPAAAERVAVVTALEGASGVPGLALCCAVVWRGGTDES